MKSRVYEIHMINVKGMFNIVQALAYIYYETFFHFLIFTSNNNGVFRFPVLYLHASLKVERLMISPDVRINFLYVLALHIIFFSLNLN